MCNFAAEKKVEGLNGRVVYRSNNNANANGGLVYSNANNASSNSNTNIGTRLTLRTISVSNGRKQSHPCYGDVSPEYMREIRASATASMMESRNISKGPEGMDIQFPLDNLIPEIVSDENMFESFDYVVSHLEHKKQRDKYKPHRESIVRQLQKEIGDGSFRITRDDVNDIHVTDGPKERDCQAPRVVKRVGVHAIMVIVEKYTYPTLIKNTAASIKGRGMHWLHHIIEEDRANVPDMMSFYWLGDIEHFYDNISQDRMKLVIRKYVSDAVLLPMLDCFITLLPYGLSKGLRSSQCFANLYLSPVDHEMLKHVKSYVLQSEDGEEVRYLYDRYMDDVVFWGNDKKELWRLRDIYVREVAKLGLKVKHSEAVRPIEVGLDHLGYIQYEDFSLIRKRTKQKAARKLAKVKSRKRRQEIIGSFKGMACHADCKHLFYILTGKHMKKFSEMGVTYTPEDGKKRFPGKVVRLSSLQNKEIEIHDYEKDVTTSQGDGRYLVSFREKKTGEWAKFFTASEEMKQILDKVSDIEDGFPFETVIESEVFDGNKVKYSFT